MPFSLDTVKSSVLNQIVAPPSDVLDIGSGDGKLLAAIKHKFPDTKLYACDYSDQFLKIDDCELSVVNIDEDNLPYKDQQFDIVTITEVIEHLENYHKVIREVFRVLKPKGRIIITTPNILNLNSRIGFFKFGFWNLFGPLPLDKKSLESTAGHITPVHYFHLVYSLSHASFQSIQLSCDKIQKTSFAYYILFYPLIKLWSLSFIKREKRKFKTINDYNIKAAKSINSFYALTARSILVTAQKG